MARCAKLLEAALRNAEGLRFMELCALAECHGWRFSRQRGSHQVYKRPGHPQRLTFHEGENGSAKGYQVQQFLAAIQNLEDERDP